MARGEIRSAFSMTEPHAGSDVQAIRTRAVRDGDDYVINGQKMWATNGLRAGIVMLLAVTDPDARPRHTGMTCFIVEKEPGVSELPGLTIPPPLKKLGYKGVESTELVFEDFRIPAGSILGGADQTGVGFKQFMAGIELGRVNIAARALGIARLAFEESIRYAQEREAFGKPIAQHQLIQAKIAQMATKIRAAELLILDAAERKNTGERADLEAGHGEAVRDRDRRGGRAGGDAHPRRLRVLAGVPDRAPVPRRPAAAHRRGLQRDPAAADRPAAAGAAQGLSVGGRTRRDG